jgi:hypothetical protein
MEESIGAKRFIERWDIQFTPESSSDRDVILSSWSRSKIRDQGST